MRVLINACDLSVGDQIVGQGKITSIVSDATEVVITCTHFSYTVAPEHAVWIERPTYVAQPTGMGTFG